FELRRAPLVLHSFPTRRSSDLVEQRPNHRRCVSVSGKMVVECPAHVFGSNDSTGTNAVGAQHRLDPPPERASVPRRVGRAEAHLDRKSTRLNSSHLGISYAVFC